jgi:hypothetical protein
MDIRFTHINLVFDFEDSGFNSQKIYTSFIPAVRDVMSSNGFVIPSDWALIFQAGFSNGKKPLVSKNRIGSYSSDKLKYITVIIPIPLVSEIGWGVRPVQHLYNKDHYDKLMKNFYALNIDYNDYSSREDYITACLKEGIIKSFQEGFTVGGIKIKTTKPIVL